MRLSISNTTFNRRFVKSLRRQAVAISDLKQRFENTSTSDCIHEILLLAFVDRERDFLRVVSGDKDFFEVEVGHDFECDYPPEDDVLLIQLIEEKLMLALDACEELGEARAELKALVESWTTENIEP